MARSPLCLSLLLLLLAVAVAVAGASTFDEENPIRTVVSNVLREFETSVVNVVGYSRQALSFARFAHRYGKSYETEEEMKLRFSIFSENLKLIKSHNRKGLSYTMAVNKFADWTWEEFHRLRLGAAQNCSATKKGNHKLTDDLLPEMKDWREIGIVSPVKDQGHCGSCWTFSTTGALEAAYRQAFGKEVSLSEQQLVDCAGAFNNFGCSGGLPSQAFEYIKHNGGLDTEEAYPYTAKDGECKFSSENVGVQVLESVNITLGAEDELKHAVAFVRPVSVAFEVVNGFRLYKDGVYTSDSCGTTPMDVNHAVLAVGYGVENGVSYWLVKNSWGEDWGDNGYFKMELGKNMCGRFLLLILPVYKLTKAAHARLGHALQLVHHTPLLVDCCLRKRGLLSRDFWFMSSFFYLECSVSPIYKLKGHVVMLIAQAQCTNKNRPSIPIVTVNWFEKLKNPSTRRRRRRWQQKDTPLRTSHLLKKTPCSLTYCTSLPYLVIGSLQALSEVFYTVFYWQAGYAILAAAAPWIFHSIQPLLSPLLCSCGVILLIVTGIFQQYLVYQVQKIRLQGYYVFSQKLKHIVRLPFAATAYGTAAMLLVMVWKPHISILSISVLLRIIMLIEVVCAGFFMSAYIGYIYQYNSLDSQPDVLKSLYSPLQPSSSLEGLSMIAAVDCVLELMLQLWILRLQESLSKYERSNDGSTPQVDLAHLLAARDQELRTLSAEMNQLQSELRLARSLIAERDSEIQRVRTTNNQYVEENERLRAILGEWSTRAAKLERALEAERMSNLELQKKVLTVVRNQPSHESAEPS
ncbi:hypothetical protein RHGRI_008890 [Rhododendron griersonianum]|uniref:Cysteine protease n=1 Tax=Rhododendron griersonianum TaxID=479676 RepID=A0AAV6L4J1_9ERIC|nr:hypothetical protein RHGRI_008890 [Rhododendron griersonianum]